jgi:hypothetical protein
MKFFPKLSITSKKSQTPGETLQDQQSALLESSVLRARTGLPEGPPRAPKVTSLVAGNRTTAPNMPRPTGLSPEEALRKAAYANAFKALEAYANDKKLNPDGLQQWKKLELHNYILEMETDGVEMASGKAIFKQAMTLFDENNKP